MREARQGRRAGACERRLCRGERVARILRGDIVWAELNPAIGKEQAGKRPVVILSHDVFNERSGTVIAVAVTSHEPRAGFPLTLEITSARLPKRSWVKVAQIRTLSVERLDGKIGHISPEEVARIIE